MSKVDCLRCAQYCENKNPNVSRTKYGKIMTFPYSYDSNRKKSRFIRKWDAKHLNNFWSKVPKLGDIPF